MTQKSEVKSFVRSRINEIGSFPDSKSIAVLARLRRGIGKRPGEIPELWEWMMTDEQLRFSEPTYEEWASYIALTLYAFHQQGNDIKQHQMNTDKRDFAQAMSLLSGGDKEARNRIQNRMNQIANSDSIEMLAALLRQMVSLLRKEGIGFDYSKLAEDLFEYQYPDGRPHVLLRWGRSFCQINKGKEENENTTDNKGESL